MFKGRTRSFTPVFLKLSTFSYAQFKAWVLCLTILVYALWGSPTPDDPGVLELVLGGLLIFIVGFEGLGYALRVRQGAVLPQITIAQLFLYAGLSFPVIAAVIADHPLTFVARDLTAFLFMVLPLFLWPLLQREPKACTILLYSVVALGVIFAVRTRLAFPFIGSNDSLYYLSNMPSVLFAAIYLAGIGLNRFSCGLGAFCIGRTLLLMALAYSCLLLMIETQQRASLGAFALSMIIILAVNFIKAPKRTALVIIALAAAIVVYWASIYGVIESLLLKTSVVGGNMRAQEWQAVWNEVSGNPLSIMFGQGWGAMLSDPAVAGIRVNFTHGLASSMVLKMGVFGCLLALAYVLTLLYTALKYLKTDTVMVLALAAPILIDTFLYASFKSLDFGLVLALIPALLYAKEKNSIHS